MRVRYLASASGQVGTSSAKPHWCAKRVAPSPTRKRCGVLSMTARATRIGLRTRSMAPTAAKRPSPVMSAASIWMVLPSRRMLAPVPALKRGSFSRCTEPAIAASRTDPPRASAASASAAAACGPSATAGGEPTPPWTTTSGPARRSPASVGRASRCAAAKAGSHASAQQATTSGRAARAKITRPGLGFTARDCATGRRRLQGDRAPVGQGGPSLARRRGPSLLPPHFRHPRSTTDLLARFRPRLTNRRLFRREGIREQRPQLEPRDVIDLLGPQVDRVPVVCEHPPVAGIVAVLPCVVAGDDAEVLVLVAEAADRVAEHVGVQLERAVGGE